MAKQVPSFAFHNSRFIETLLELLQLKRYTDLFTEEFVMIVAIYYAEGKTISIPSVGKIDELVKVNTSSSRETYEVSIGKNNGTRTRLVLEYNPQTDIISVSDKNEPPQGAHYILARTTSGHQLQGYTGEEFS